MPDTRGAIALTTNYPLDKAKHGSPEIHKIGQSLLDPTFVSSLGPGVVATVGQSDEVARADHVHGMNHFVVGGFSYSDSFLVLTTSNQYVPGIGNFIAPTGRPGTCMCWATWDFDAPVSGFGAGSGFMYVSRNSGPYNALNHVVVYAIGGGTRLTLMSQGTIPLGANDNTYIVMGASKNTAGGTLQLQNPHTTLQTLAIYT